MQRRAFGKPMIVVFANEMNGDWFPWSGIFYGGGQRDPGQNNGKGPEKFRTAYRYVVDRVRARGATNIKWMFHTNNYSYPYDTWNLAAAYYPGSDYVDWLGLSVYGKQYKDEPWANVFSLIDWPYKEICGLDPNKPVMIAEWGDRRIPACRQQRRVDQGRSRSFSHALSADQGGRLLARALAKPRPILQQSARQFVGRVIERLSPGRREPGLVGRPDSAAAAGETEAVMSFPLPGRGAGQVDRALRRSMLDAQRQGRSR